MSSGPLFRRTQALDPAVATSLDALALSAVLLLDALALPGVENVFERLVMQDLELGQLGLRLDARLGHLFPRFTRQRVRVGSTDALGVEPLQG